MSSPFSEVSLSLSGFAGCNLMNSAPYSIKSTHTHTLSSRQILGPTTLAAPLAILKAKCFSGQAFEIPHLYLGGFVALEDK